MSENGYDGSGAWPAEPQKGYLVPVASALAAAGFAVSGGAALESSNPAGWLLIALSVTQAMFAGYRFAIARVERKTQTRKADKTWHDRNDPDADLPRTIRAPRAEVGRHEER